jgi:hypothetical protein
MIPHDILSQIFDHPPEDDNITWSDDVIRVQSISFRRQLYTRADINLSQGIVYFFQGTQVVLKLAIEVQLKVITTASEPTDDSDSPDSE